MVRLKVEKGLFHLPDFDLISPVSTQDSSSFRKSTPYSVNTFGREETTREPEKQPHIPLVCNLPRPSLEEVATWYEMFKDYPTILREIKDSYQEWFDSVTREEANETFETRRSLLDNITNNLSQINL